MNWNEVMVWGISGVVLAIFLLRMLETGINRIPQISNTSPALIQFG